MKVDDTTLEDLLEGTKQFVVPRFQRIYSWEKKHWEELWRDLLDVYDEETTREHFMGAIVTMPIEMQPHGVSKFLLIDGQQRLTTIFVILACIRDLVGEQNTLSEKIDDLYLLNKYGKDGNRHKLLPTQADKDAFLEIINGDALNESNVRNVYKHFVESLQGVDEGGNPIDLEVFLEAMIGQLVFVSIVIDANDSPYRIFHSLNATGLPLTQADLVRNHIFMNIDADDQEVAYNDLWLPMQESFTVQALEDFMWRFMTKDGTFVRQNGVYDSMRRRMDKNAPEDVADIMLIDMKVASDHYKMIIEPMKEITYPELRNRLARLNTWEVNTVYPLLMNLYEQLHANRISVREFCNVIDIIESYIVRRFFCSIPTNSLSKYFIQLCRHIDASSNVVKSTAEFLVSRRFPSDKDFRAGWTTHSAYNSSPKRSKHILTTLEFVMNENNELVDVSNPRITCEHVMPQELSPEWKRQLGANAESIHATYLHTIGNLTLTGKNEAMSNKPFFEKQKIFEQSGFALNSGFREFEKWDEDAICTRASLLFDIAVTIWQRPEE